MLPGPRSTSLPSGILIDPAVWPQQTWAENWGASVPPFWGRELGLHLTQCGLAETYLPTKWHLDPSIRLATTDMGRKWGGAVPLWGGGAGPHLTQCGLDRGLPPHQVSS